MSRRLLTARRLPEVGSSGVAMMEARLPAAVDPGGTSDVTTALAPTVAFVADLDAAEHGGSRAEEDPIADDGILLVIGRLLVLTGTGAAGMRQASHAGVARGSPHLG